MQRGEPRKPRIKVRTRGTQSWYTDLRGNQRPRRRLLTSIFRYHSNDSLRRRSLLTIINQFRRIKRCGHLNQLTDRLIMLNKFPFKLLRIS